jgi:hypothetical protein
MLFKKIRTFLGANNIKKRHFWVYLTATDLDFREFVSLGVNSYQHRVSVLRISLLMWINGECLPISVSWIPLLFLSALRAAPYPIPSQFDYTLRISKTKGELTHMQAELNQSHPEVL